MTIASFPMRPALRGAALGLLLTSLAACMSDRGATTGSLAPSPDVRAVHPIVIGNAPRILDLFVEGERGLSTRSRRDLHAFVAEQRSLGNSLMVVQVPVGAENAFGTRAALQLIREATRGQAKVESYRPADPSIGSPIRLSFKRLQARVSDSCGLWPEDLGVSDYEFHAANRTWHNFGCAAQSNLASQVADPNDLVRPRQMTPPDTPKRMNDIEKLRIDIDPSTAWRDTSGGIRSSITNN